MMKIPPLPPLPPRNKTEGTTPSSEPHQNFVEITPLPLPPRPQTIKTTPFASRIPPLVEQVGFTSEVNLEPLFSEEYVSRTQDRNMLAGFHNMDSEVTKLNELLSEKFAFILRMPLNAKTAYRAAVQTAEDLVLDSHFLEELTAFPLDIPSSQIQIVKDHFGVTTLKSAKDLIPSVLDDAKSMGPAKAEAFYNAVQSYSAEIVLKVRIDLRLGNTDKAIGELLSHLFLMKTYGNSHANEAEVDDVLLFAQRFAAQPLPVEELHGFTYFFFPRAESRVSARHLLARSLNEWNALPMAEAVNAETIRRDQRMWNENADNAFIYNDFLNDSASYYALLSRLLPAGTSNDMDFSPEGDVFAGGGLGKEVWEEINAVELNLSRFNASLRPYQEFGVKYCLHQKRTLLGDDMGLGKALPNSEPVLTPIGFQQIGVLKVGELVIGQNGQPTKITGVYPQGVRDIYTITFHDGSFVNCDLDHLWSVQDISSGANSSSWQTLTTSKLIAEGLADNTGQLRYQIPMMEAVEFLQTDDTLPLINTSGTTLEDYKLASIADRLHMVQILMGIHGWINQTGTVCEFSTTDKSLLETFVWLVQSLGGTCKIVKSETEKVGERSIFRTAVNLPQAMNPFNTSLMSRRWDERKEVTPSRFIERIEFSHVEEATCIKVEASDELFVTRNFVVTHNTIQAIAVMAHLTATATERPAHLVVAPLSVQENWARELTLHSSLKACVVRSKDQKVIAANYDVIVTTYERISEKLRNQITGAVIVDEAHFVKNPETQRTQRVLAAIGDREHAMFMTGTAIENNLEELSRLIELVNPAISKNLDALSAAPTPQAYRSAIAASYLRRNKEDVLTELPELTVKDEWVEMGLAERDYYKQSLDANWHSIRKVGYARVDFSKITRMAEIILNSVAKGEKILIFSYYLEVLDTIERVFKKIPQVRVDGSVDSLERQALVDKFNNAVGTKIFLSQINTGGVGLNLQSASRIILCEPQIKFSLETQAIARAHRMGQLNPVIAHRLATIDTIDERIIELRNGKQKLFDEYAKRTAMGDMSIELEDEGKSKRLILAEERLKHGVITHV